MPGDVEVAISEGLEDRDLLPLQSDEPADHHVEQEGRHAEEDGREDRGGGLQLFQFLRQEAVGELILARIGTRAAIGAQHGVHAVEHVLHVGASGQRRRGVVEGAFHVVGGGERVAAHPQHAVALEVREHGPRGDLVHVFRRYRHADDGERLAFAIDDGGELVAGLEAVRVGEGVGQHHLIRTVGLHHAPALEMQRIEQGLAAVRHRQQQARDGVGEALHLQLHPGDHPGLQPLHPGNLAQALRHRFRRALQIGKHFGEAVFAVEAVARGRQRIVGGERHHQRRHPTHDHCRDGQYLAAHVPEIAQEFAVEGAHALPG
jgi:hypothetical protein